MAGDAAFERDMARYFRRSASPQAAVALLRMNTQTDIRDVLPAIRVPTLVMNRIDDRDVMVEEARYIAGRIPGAKLVELPGGDHTLWVGDVDGILDEVEGFLTGVRRGPDTDRVLTTVLFTDIVGSTERAAELGDRAWSELVERHHSVIRRELERFRGREVDTAGDGFLATFDGPARGVRCAAAAVEGIRGSGWRSGQACTRGRWSWPVMRCEGSPSTSARASPGRREAGEVLVSRTVRDLVSGSGIVFADRGEHALKGVPEPWQVYAVESV